MKQRGADLRPFEKPPEQMAFEQATQSWQQTVMELVKANPQITPQQYPPQPTPQQYGYTPQGNGVASSTDTTKQTTNNITNNITDNRQE